MTPAVQRAPEEPAFDAAVGVLAADGLVAFPTETVWGIAARASSADAVTRLRACKGTDADKPISVLVSGLRALEALQPELSSQARALVERSWPGPLTLVVHCGLSLAPGVAGPNGATGFRCSPHPVAVALVHAAEAAGLGPLTATSLNETGHGPAATRVEAERFVRASAWIALLLPGEAGGGAPSTVVDATGPDLDVLRAGAIELAPAG